MRETEQAWVRRWVPAVVVLALCVGVALVPASAVGETGSSVNNTTPGGSADGAGATADNDTGASVVGTTGAFTVSESVVAEDRPDPETDRLGWEHGVWANATLAVDQTAGITETELEAVVARTMARVESIRGIEFDRTPPVRILLTEEQQSIVNSGELGAIDREEASQTALNTVYEATFLIGESEDAVESREALLGAVNGYYQSTTGNVTMVSPDSTARQIREAILAQELFHAQQDNQFELPETETIEQRNTRNSYVEGDANYVQELYEQRCETTWGGTCYRPDRTAVPDTTGIDDGMSRLFRQPYESGYAFVQDRHQQTGWDAVNSLYEQPPASTEQVIHPGTYREDDPTELRVSDRSTDRWRPLEANGERLTESLGEGGLYVSLLGPTLERDGYGVVIPRESHLAGGSGAPTYSYDHPATAGWDGDTLLPYVSTVGNETGYVHETVWDTPADAREFHGAYRELLAYHGADQVPGLSNAYRIPAGSEFTDALHLNRTGNRLRIVNAPSVDALSELRQGVEQRSNTSEPVVPWERATLDWAFTATESGLDSPAVSDGVVYLRNGTGTLAAVDGATGETVWERAFDRRLTSSPLVSDGTVYLRTAGPGLVAVDGASGDTRWTTQVNGTVVASPVVVDETVHLTTLAGRVQAIDATSGEQVWSHRVNGSNAGTAVAGNNSIFVGDSAGLTAVDTTTGQETWRVEFGGRPVTPPQFAGGAVYAATLNTTTGTTSLHAVDAQTGDRLWTHRSSGFVRYTVSDGTVYTGATTVTRDGARTGNLTAVDGSGDTRWRVELNGSVREPPVVSNGSVYAADTGGRVVAVRADTGEHRWTATVDDGSSPLLVVADERVYAGGGALTSLDAATGDEQWRFLADGLAPLSPLSSTTNGTVYATGETTLYAVEGSMPGDGDDPTDDDPDDGDPTDNDPTDGDPDDGDPDDGDPDDDDPDDNDPDDGDPDDDSSDGSGAGFGVLVVGIALVVAAVVARLRR
jgi:outer membrane protein assembly factor BamB